MNELLTFMGWVRKNEKRINYVQLKNCNTFGRAFEYCTKGIYNRLTQAFIQIAKYLSSKYAFACLAKYYFDSDNYNYTP